MRYWDRLRWTFLPRIDPDHVEAQGRSLRNTAVLVFAFLALWFGADLIHSLSAPSEAAYTAGFDALLLALAAAGCSAALLLVQRGRLIAAGYLLAAAPFVLTTISVVAYPQTVLMASAGFPLSILVVGITVGGPSVYPFGAAAALALALAWLLGRDGPLPEAFPYRSVQGLVFFGSQLVVYFGTAIALHALSRQAQRVQEALRDQTERMTQLAHTDPLTGLANRRQLVDQLEREFLRARRYRRPLGLLYLDLDGFKAINDRFGHMFGDDILRNVANNMRAVLRSTDLIARIGGDEFAVLLPETPANGTENVAAKLHRALASYSQRLGPAVTPLTVCIGASQLREQDASIDDVLTRADTALLAAKAAGTGSTRTELDLPA